MAATRRSNLDNASATLLLLARIFTPMAKKDPRIDAYIAKAAPFARPILTHLRKVVHRGCPEVVETIKWSMPHFDYNGIFVGMAAFKQHCSFGFWRDAALALDGNGATADGMGQFGRITSLADLPGEETLVGYVRKAAALKAAGIKAPHEPQPRKKTAPAKLPADLAIALKQNKSAEATWDSFSNSHRKEYVEWICEAKREETRAKRLETTLAQLAEGKSLNWKYQRR